MATHHRDFEGVRDSIDFNGDTIVDHSHHIAEDVEHPDNKAAKAAYQEHVHGLPMVAAIQGVHDTGSSPKVHFSTPTHHFMVKPYHEQVPPNVAHALHYPYAGWAEMTTQGLFHAGGIGHLCQRVHTTQHEISEGEHEPFYAVHLDPHRNIPVHHFHAEVLREPADENDRNPQFRRPVQVYDDAAKIGFMDFLSNNIDRHDNNLLYQKPLPGEVPKNLLAIDHSYNFQYKTAPPESVDSGAKPHDHLFYYLTDSGGMHALARHGMGPWDQQHVTHAVRWWQNSGRDIRHEFDRHLMAVNDDKVAKWLSKNFNARADALDRFSNAFSAAPDPDFYSPWGKEEHAAKLARVPIWRHKPVFPFNDVGWEPVDKAEEAVVAPRGPKLAPPVLPKFKEEVQPSEPVLVKAVSKPRPARTVLPEPIWEMPPAETTLVMEPTFKAEPPKPKSVVVATVIEPEPVVVVPDPAPTRQRIELEATARVFLPIMKFEDQDDLSIRSAVIQKIQPSVVLDGRSPEYVQARFDIAVEEALARLLAPEPQPIQPLVAVEPMRAEDVAAAVTKSLAPALEKLGAPPAPREETEALFTRDEEGRIVGVRLVPRKK
jgi:hypothetical protein